MSIIFVYWSQERGNRRVSLKWIFEKYHVKVVVWIDVNRTGTNWLVVL